MSILSIASGWSVIPEEPFPFSLAALSTKSHANALAVPKLATILYAGPSRLALCDVQFVLLVFSPSLTLTSATCIPELYTLLIQLIPLL